MSVSRNNELLRVNQSYSTKCLFCFVSIALGSLYLLLFLLLIATLSLVFTACGHEHSYGEWTVEKEATCTEDGSKVRICECGEKETASMAAKGHTGDEWITDSKATCTETGSKHLVCSVCTETIKTESISATGKHNYTSKVTTEATCTQDGVKTFTCSMCKDSYTEAIAAKGHTTSQGECTRCHEYIGVRPTTPKYISNRSINHKDGYFYFLFSFLDDNKNEIKAGATVDIRIVNSENETVYSKTHTVSEKDFGTWENKYYAKQWLAASIYIYDSDITPGRSSSGMFYYKIKASNGLAWDEYSLEINGDLPIKKATIVLPTLPTTIHDYSYSGKIDSSVKITNITYEISGDDLYFYFTGEKTYDAEGNKYSQSCKVGWKLYDSEGYIVDSGTFYSPNIAVGEKFKNEKEYAWDVIKPGETYTLVILNVD